MKKVVFITIFCSVVYFVLNPNLALAEPPPTPNPINGTCGIDAINTAIGCIPFDDATSFAGFFIRWGVGLGGGIAFLLIVYASFLIMTSSGDPQRLKAGQELLTSAIAGLIMLIFSVFLLKFIGVDILNLPGLSI